MRGAVVNAFHFTFLPTQHKLTILQLPARTKPLHLLILLIMVLIKIIIRTRETR